MENRQENRQENKSNPIPIIIMDTTTGTEKHFKNTLYDLLTFPCNLIIDGKYKKYRTQKESEEKKKMIYYIENYYTDEIIDVSNDLNKAIEICKSHDDSMVTDENDNCYYSNINLPF